MRFIPTRIHGLMDYVMGALMLASPWLFGFSDHAAATWTVVGVALLALGQSLMTDYETGVIRSIPMRMHLMMDMLAGAFLAVSPWLFGFAETVWLPHVLFGILEIGAAMMTRTVPSDLPVAAAAGSRARAGLR